MAPFLYFDSNDDISGLIFVEMFNIITIIAIKNPGFYSGAADNGTLMRRDGGNNCFCSLHTGEKPAQAIGKDLFNI